MPNTLTIVFTSTPSNQPVEFQNPNSPGVYVPGIQQTNGTWQVIFTGVTKGTYGALTARLKNFPAISATIAASNAVLNIVPPAPQGTSASGTGTGTGTGISVTASTSPNGLANRILASGSSGGTFAQIYQGAASGFTHLLAGGTVQYYRYQYVGDGGFYDDSLLSLVFQGTAPAASTVATTLNVTSTNLAYNSRNLTNNGGTQYDALSEFTIVTDSANLTVNAYGFNESGYNSGIADVWVNGVEFVGGVPGVFPTATTGVATFQLTGLPITAGTPLSVRFTLAGQQNYMGTRPFNTYVSLTSVVVPAGFSGAITTPVAHPNELIYVYGDSTTQYNGAFSWDKVLNRNFRPNADIFVTGASALVGGVFIADATKQAALLADYKATRAQGGYAKGKFWFDSMVNDCFFNSYTPNQLNAFYIAFAQMFLGDAALLNDTLYFKSAIPNTAHGNGYNTMSPPYPLFAYRDAMSAAVNTVASPRVRYADGTALQQAQYLVDGTHVNRAGDAYVAGTINDFLNQTATTGASGSLNSITANQFGGSVFVSTDSIQTVEYAMETASGSGAFSNWQLAANFETPLAGSRIFRARLQATPTTAVSTTKVINKSIFANSAELTKVGTWINQGGGATPTRTAYTLTKGDYYTFTDVFTGFSIYQNRQENCQEILVSIDGGPGVIINISGPGYNYTPQRVYTVTGLAAGTHTVRVDSGASSVMNIYGIELLGNANAPASTGAAFTITGVQKAAITTPQVGGYGTSSRIIAVTPSVADAVECSFDGAAWVPSTVISLETLGISAPLQTYYARRVAAQGSVMTAQLQLMPFYRTESAGGYTTESAAGTGWTVSTASAAFPSWYMSANTTEALIITLAAGESAEIWARQQANITQVDMIVFGGARAAVATGGYTYDASIGIIYTSAPAPAGGGTIKIYKNASQPAAIISYFRRIKP